MNSHLNFSFSLNISECIQRDLHCLPQAAGKCWMDAMELSMRCSSILLRSMTSSPGRGVGEDSTDGGRNKWDDADIEKHFMDQGKFLDWFFVFCY